MKGTVNILSAPHWHTSQVVGELSRMCEVVPPRLE